MSLVVNRNSMPADGQLFRISADYLRIGIVSGVFCSTMAIVSTVAALGNWDGSFARPKLAALILGSVWSSLLLVPIGLIASYYRGRLILGTATIIQHGVIRSQSMELREVIQVQWQERPVGGSIVLQTVRERLTIPFDKFSRADRKELIRSLREAFPPDIQQNWSRFEERFNGSPRSEKARLRELLTLAAIFTCFAGVFAYCWLAELGTQYLTAAVVNSIAVVWILSKRRSTAVSPDSHVTRPDRHGSAQPPADYDHQHHRHDEPSKLG